MKKMEIAEVFEEFLPYFRDLRIAPIAFARLPVGSKELVNGAGSLAALRNRPYHQ
jgi:hypothetical protein